MTDATKLQPLLPKNPSVWVRRNGAPFTSGVAHFGRVCPPGWVGAAEPYYSEAEKEAARAPLLAEIEALRKRAEDAERDAARYRAFFERGPVVCFDGREFANKGECDSAIDAAIKGAAA